MIHLATKCLKSLTARTAATRGADVCCFPTTSSTTSRHYEPRAATDSRCHWVVCVTVAADRWCLQRAAVVCTRMHMPSDLWLGAMSHACVLFAVARLASSRSQRVVTKFDAFAGELCLSLRVCTCPAGVPRAVACSSRVRASFPAAPTSQLCAKRRLRHLTPARSRLGLAAWAWSCCCLRNQVRGRCGDLACV